tara:strand:- start:7031 stop:7270 length:240 start_codon:yes stop_codon:yes gene_type:complete
MWLFLGAMVSAVITSAITLYRARLNGPDNQINSLTASDKLIGRLETRIDKLEERVEAMEAELDRYYALYGPLPSEDENS